MPFLSVLIPVYNGEHYLADAIESVLDQPCQDLELIVANDGSTDRSLEIARKYEAQDSRVRVVTHENCGPGMTRNLAMPTLAGSWTLFLDCDDIVLPGFYTEAVRDLLQWCGTNDIETVVPCRLYGNVDLSRANMEYVPHDEVFPQGSNASWDVNYEFATLLYSTAMLRREHIEFGITRPAEMESIFRHKAVFCSKRALFTNKLWFAVRRENPQQATKAKDWDSIKVDRIRYDGFNELIAWHKKRNTTGFVIEEATRRRNAAAAAIKAAEVRKPPFKILAERRQKKRDYDAWIASRRKAERPLQAWELNASQQQTAIEAIEALPMP